LSDNDEDLSSLDRSFTSRFSSPVGKVDLQRDEKVFHDILVDKLGFDTSSVAFLEDQGISSILLLHFLPVHALELWQQENLMKPVHASILLAFRLHIGDSRRLYNGNLPAIW
jgi:hypothetical protein